MRTLDICWLAGLLEGEGWFGAPRKGASLKIGVQSSDRDVIERAAALLGGPVYGPYTTSGHNLKSASTRDEPYKARFTTVVSGRVAAGWMMTLFPQLSTRRRERVSQSLKAWMVLPPPNSEKRFCARGHAFDSANVVYKSNGWRRCRKCVKEDNLALTSRRRNRLTNSTGGLQVAVSDK